MDYQVFGYGFDVYAMVPEDILALIRAAGDEEDLAGDVLGKKMIETEEDMGKVLEVLRTHYWTGPGFGDGEFADYIAECLSAVIPGNSFTRFGTLVGIASSPFSQKGGIRDEEDFEKRIRKVISGNDLQFDYIVWDDDVDDFALLEDAYS